MAVLFFDVYDGSDISRDDEGGEVLSLKAARREAVLTLLDVMRSRALDAENHSIAIHVRDDAGRVVLTAELSLVCRWPEGTST